MAQADIKFVITCAVESEETNRKFELYHPEVGFLFIPFEDFFTDNYFGYLGIII